MKNSYLSYKGGRFLDIFSLISIAGTIIGLLAFAIIAIKHRRNPYQKFLFLLFIFSLAYNSFLTFLAVSGLLLDYPHFYRTASPLVYCIPISLFLLGKAIGRKQEKPTRTDLIFFAIPLIQVAELMPFFLQDADYKLKHLENLPLNPDIMVFDRAGLIPNAWHYFIQMNMGIALMVVTFARTLKYREIPIRTPRRRKLIWINWISLFLGCCFLVMVLLLLTDSEGFPTYIYGSFIFMATLLVVFTGLFLEPLVLYGTSPSAKTRRKGKLKELPFLSREEAQFKVLLEGYFDRETDFLEPSFRQSDLARHLNLSKNSLSYLINRVYQMNFNTLINEKRIEVALGYLESSKGEHLSMEGIAREVGFKSRTTFIKAFKMKTGYTPSQHKTA